MSIPGKIISYGDTTVLQSLNDNIDVLSILDPMSDWFGANGLCMNVNKTQSIIFSLSNNECNLEAVKLLGIWLDNKLSWNRHTDELCKKLSVVIFLLRRLKQSVSMKILTDAYYSFFHCHLNYGILFWGNSAGAKDVFLLQKKALRILKGIGTRQSCRQVFVEMKILTVASLYVLACLTFIHNNKDNYTQLSEVHLYSTRNRHNLLTPKCRLQKSHNSYIIMGIQLYNKLPLYIRNIQDINIFKRRIKNMLTEINFYNIHDYIQCNDFTV